MKKEKLVQYSLAHSLGTLVYIFLVATLMWKGNDWFGKINSVIGVVGFLLLFVLSATVVGGLVLGKPLMLYLDGDKKEAVKLLLYTLGWLLVWLIVVFAVTALI